MKILVTGACGFVGSWICRELLQRGVATEVFGLDNLSRPGSEVNRRALMEMGVRFVHGDVREAADFGVIPRVDWVVDAAANPSVLAGIGAGSGSRRLIDINLGGTINLLEYCKTHQAGFVLLSTSRVYSIAQLSAIAVQNNGMRYELDPLTPQVNGLTHEGVDERFSTTPPLSLYGSTKLCSEQLALEYGAAFGFPVWVNRCGVLAGAGQFGKPDQGIFAYWLHSWREGKPLKYIGFEGLGYQVRDCLHPRDLVVLLTKQLEVTAADRPQVVNVSGGLSSAMSLRSLSEWCERRWGPRPVERDLTPRPFDLPWIVLDHTLATNVWGWAPQISVGEILTEIADFADERDDWMAVSQ